MFVGDAQFCRAIARRGGREIFIGKYWPENVYMRAHRRCNYRRINARFTRARHALSAESRASAMRANCIFVEWSARPRVSLIECIIYFEISADRRICFSSARQSASRAACCPAASYRMSQMYVIVSVTSRAKHVCFDAQCTLCIYLLAELFNEFKISFSFGPRPQQRAKPTIAVKGKTSQ